MLTNDLGATPGFVEGGFEYYSVDGAERLRDELPSFRGGKVLLAVLSIPFKCPPAPYEGILLLHDYLVERGIRDGSQLHVVIPQPAPIRVSVEASEAVENDGGPGHRVHQASTRLRHRPRKELRPVITPGARAIDEFFDGAAKR